MKKVSTTRIKLPGTSTVVTVTDRPGQTRFAMLQPVHEHIYPIFHEELRTRYDELRRNLGNSAKLKKALGNDPIMEIKISVATIPFGCQRTIQAVDDFLSMGITLWGKGWWASYNLFLHASFPANYDKDPIITVSVAVRVAKRLMSR